jgi:glyoxylase-like metal-dependent hydrolase (beta-lactamase superfamily II)
MTVDVTLHTVGYCRNRAWFVDRSSFTTWLTLPALVARIRHPRLGTILFDTGYGRPLIHLRMIAAQAYRHILPFLLPPEQELQVSGIDLVFLSHFHPDHIGALRDVPSVPILHSREGLAILRSLRGLNRWRSAFFPELLPDDFPARASAIEDLPLVHLPTEYQPFEQAYDVAGDGSLLAIELPGHAPGQYGLLCRLTNDRTLFLVADAAWVQSNITRLAFPAWPVRALVSDYTAFTDTLRKLHTLHVNRPEIILVPSHCAQSIQAFIDGQ